MIGNVVNAKIHVFFIKKILFLLSQWICRVLLLVNKSYDPSCTNCFIIPFARIHVGVGNIETTKILGSSQARPSLQETSEVASLLDPETGLWTEMRLRNSSMLKKEGRVGTTSRKKFWWMLNHLQMSTVPSTAEILPWIVTKPALPASCNSLEPTESNVPAKQELLHSLVFAYIESCS